MSPALSQPPFDPEVAAVLANFAEQTPTVITAEMIPALRPTLASGGIPAELLAEGNVTRRDITFSGYEGAETVMSVFARGDHTGAAAGIYFIHGGGMIAGDRFGAMSRALPWVVEHDIVVVTVEYRLAPEFPDPYPVEDCYAGLVWTAEHSAELGIDPHRLIVAGASAGGGLAAGTALLARDRGGPELAAQLLICPMLDDRDGTVSARQYEDAGTWVRSNNVMGWTALLGARRGTDEVSVYAAPARATELAGLPPAYIDCGSAEVFRDEDVGYATALWAAGVQAELHVWPGGFHGFDVAAPHSALARACTAARNAWVARQIRVGN